MKQAGGESDCVFSDVQEHDKTVSDIIGSALAHYKDNPSWPSVPAGPPSLSALIQDQGFTRRRSNLRGPLVHEADRTTLQSALLTKAIYSLG